MLKYTICFMICGSEVLLLNRLKSPNMGLWNGIGGKLEANETPLQSIVREIKEETGLQVNEQDIEPAGIVRWESEPPSFSSGMYLYRCSLSDKAVQTPAVVDEGLLMWKPLDWVLNEDNLGVVDNIQHFLPFLLQGECQLEHIFTYNSKDELIGYRANQLDPTSRYV
ncbi:NUDIX domain-containing protein [Paenibacillus septentrionalis]|uniref:NUDIX domain-containing protein n=2 Tax=Paenibacillus septentrionalis TaxID=429342 RepID=A0ABW1VCC7_9BACL